MEMEQEQERPPPPAYAHHEPKSLQLPSVPTHALPLSSNAPNSNRLPGIKSLDLPHATVSARTQAVEPSPHSALDARQWGKLPPISHSTFPRVPEGPYRNSNEVLDVSSPVDTASVVSGGEGHSRRGTSVVSVDDPDVRAAAEALSGLGNPDFVRSPNSRSVTVTATRPPVMTTGEPEPLLSLLTSNHPWLGSTINGSISAYNATKGYSPRFVKYGAELIERNIGSPVVNTVSSVGRFSGVEQNLRRYLGEGHRRPSDLEQGDADSQRKRIRVTSPDSNAMEVDDAYTLPRTRGGSQSSFTESLPAYDDHRSPRYEEAAVVIGDGKQADPQSGAQQDRRVNWSQQLIITTSGLGVALSDTSLRSLKLCLSLLRRATTHIDSVMRALKLVLEEYEKALQDRTPSDGEAGASPRPANVSNPEKEEQVRRIADQMQRLSSEIWTTLQKVVQAVSRHTGGALPYNASQVVRTQLLSVPQRWRTATQQSVALASDSTGTGPRSGDEVRGAHRMLAFAKEGLDMMGQITTVVDGTVNSAESWLASIGRRPQERGEMSAREEKEKAALLMRDARRED